MEIQHFSHEHPLVLTQMETASGRRVLQCHVCSYRGGPEAGPLYGCELCGFYLHRSCAELQLAHKIEHPLHPPHPLVLDPGLRQPPSPSPRLYQCCCCQKQGTNFSYHCSECDYDLDQDCAALAPSLKLRDAGHLLLLIDKVGFSEYSKCRTCSNGLAGGETNSPVFLCVIPQCSYAVHLHCSPLAIPKTVRHENHNFHDLVYTGSVTEGGFWDGHYCDACEEKRNPELPVYYCKECNFASHIFCGISKELPSLIEAYENDFLQRGGSFSEALLQHFEERLSSVRSNQEKLELKLKGVRQKIDVLEEERILHEVSKLFSSTCTADFSFVRS